MRMQGRYIVGLAQLGKQLSNAGTTSESLYQQAQGLNRGPYSQRLRFVVLAGELKGPAEAREQLRQLNEHYRTARGDPPSEEASTAELLDRVYSLREEKPEAVSTLPEQSRQELRERLGWFGDVALAPAGENESVDRKVLLDSAKRTALSMILAVTIMIGMGLLGLVLLVTFSVLWVVRRVPDGLEIGSAQAGIYAETFAVYMLVYLGLSFAGRFLLGWLNLRHGTLALSGVAALCSLAALFWPLVRGISWDQVRRDIGWTLGRRPWLEPIVGIGGYLMALPMLFVALLATLGVMKLREIAGWGPDEFSSSDTPAHPIVSWVESAGWWVWLEVLFVASIVAPLVEETMFRGVLYRYLRESNARLRPLLNVLFSALLASFLFAVIHPQGFWGVPTLMTLALVFALMREWRGTLLPAMVAHGLNNALATVLLFVMLN
jgi:membrane protease YdiL (CAAX protease family)